MDFVFLAGAAVMFGALLGLAGCDKLGVRK